jgi:hypothetical protein
MKRIIAVCLLSAIALSGAMAQETLPETETLIYTVKYADYRSAGRLAMSLLSREGQVREIGDSKQLVIHDLPENLATIKAALEKMDVRPDSIMLTIYMFWADTKENSTVDLNGVPEDIREALDEVSALMPYTSFEEMGNGAIQIAATSNQARIKLSEEAYVSFKIDYNQASKFMVLHNYSINLLDSNPSTVLSTDISISDGEITVAGITRPNGTNRAIVSIVKMVVE